jgi:sugar phosphate isomerase/epimerase
MQEKKNHLIGIVQGRLSKSPKNRLQYFPKKFIDEFDIAKNIGFNYIEFFSERKLNINNPIWNNKLKENYLILSKKNNLQVITFCDDYIISNSILKNKTFYYLKNLITKIFKLKIKNLILPMYGKSLMSDLNYKKYIKTLKLILTINKKINIFLESNISPEVFSELKKQIKTKRIKFLFDTGNRSTLKRDLYADIINFGSNIGHVHIKDKNNNKINVQLGKGKVNFSKVFKNLKKINYKGNFTLETPRGSSFLNSAKKNFIFVKTLKHNNLMN